MAFKSVNNVKRAFLNIVSYNFDIKKTNIFGNILKNLSENF